jgi:hypothetical protein
MVKGTKKTESQPKKTRGRQSDFSGEKQEYLDGLTNEFLSRKDRGAFYNEAAQGLIDKFGYSRDGKVYVEADSLTSEEQLDYYKGLRSVSDQFTVRIGWNLTHASSFRNWANGSDTGAWPSRLTTAMWRRSSTQ